MVDILRPRNRRNGTGKTWFICYDSVLFHNQTEVVYDL